jgi:adenine-specific DNA methylase
LIGKEAANSRVHGGYSLARAARYVRESARRVADQAELVVALKTEGRQAPEAKAWLKIFQAFLEIARENQRKVCEQCGVVPIPGASRERLGPQHLLTRAEHHVREGERRVARQADLVEMLERGGHSSLVPPARELLTTLQESLEAARRHLRIEREAHAPAPACMGTRAAGCSQQQERS